MHSFQFGHFSNFKYKDIFSVVVPHIPLDIWTAFDYSHSITNLKKNYWLYLSTDN